MNSDEVLPQHSFASIFVPFALLHAADVSLTQFALERFGALEVNPIMATMFGQSLLAAIGLKVLAVALVGSISIYLWRLGLVRRILKSGVWLMTGVVLYQIAGILLTAANLI